MKSFYLLLLLFLSVGTGFSQTKSLKKGDKFIVKTIANTNSLFQKGKQSLEIDSRLFTIRQYTVQEVLNEGYKLIVTTNKLVDTVNALGYEVCYNSDSLKDSSSVAAKTIKEIIDTADTVFVDKNGVVLSNNNDSLHYFRDTLTAFLGLKPTYLSKGNTIEFFAGFKMPQSQENGFQWTDSSTFNQKKTSFKCMVHAVTDSSIAITFSRLLKDAYANTNTNGVVMLYKKTGIIQQQLTQNVSLEYQVLNEAILSIGRRSAVSETCVYLPVEE